MPDTAAAKAFLYKVIFYPVVFFTTDIFNQVGVDLFCSTFNSIIFHSEHITIRSTTQLIIKLCDFFKGDIFQLRDGIL